MRYWLIWFPFALVVYIPATAINGLLWQYIPCEWHRPYGKLMP